MRKPSPASQRGETIRARLRALQRSDLQRDAHPSRHVRRRRGGKEKEERAREKTRGGVDFYGEREKVSLLSFAPPVRSHARARPGDFYHVWWGPPPPIRWEVGLDGWAEPSSLDLELLEVSSVVIFRVLSKPHASVVWRRNHWSDPEALWWRGPVTDRKMLAMFLNSEQGSFVPASELWVHVNVRMIQTVNKF